MRFAVKGTLAGPRPPPAGRLGGSAYGAIYGPTDHFLRFTITTLARDSEQTLTSTAEARVIEQKLTSTAEARVSEQKRTSTAEARVSEAHEYSRSPCQRAEAHEAQESGQLDRILIGGSAPQGPPG